MRDGEYFAQSPQLQMKLVYFIKIRNFGVYKSRKFLRGENDNKTLKLQNHRDANRRLITNFKK